jgi:hypothetical protein
MIRTFRSLAVAAAACAIALIGAGSAQALTLSPTGVQTGEGQYWNFDYDSHGLVFVCDDMTVPVDFAADGTGTVAAGSARFGSTCWSDRTTAVQTAAWSVRTALTGSAVELTLTIPAGGLQLTPSGCTYTVSGSVTFSAPYTSLPATVDTFAPSGGGLTIDWTNRGFGCYIVQLGLTLSLVDGWLTFESPALTFSR